MTRYIIMLLMLTLAAGCGKQEQATPDAEDAAAGVDEGAAFSALFDQARAHYQEGDTDSAVDLLTEGLADPQFVANQSTIFRALIELLLLENRIVDAQTNYLAMLNASPDTATQAFNMIPTHLKRQEDPAAYLAWCEQMVSADLPEGIRESAYAYLVDANVQARNLDKLDGLTRASLDLFGAGGAVRVLTRPLNALVDTKEYDAIRSALAVLTETGDKAALDYVAGMELSLAAAQGQWDTVLSTFKQKAAGLPDNAARLALRTVADRAMKADRADVVDQLCEHVMTALPDAAATRGQAATLYLDVAVKAGNYDEVVTRLQKMKEAGSGDRLQQKISGVFYDVMSKGSDASKQALLKMVESMLDAAGEGGNAQLQALLMDGAVLCSDYRLALKVLDSGFRSDDKEWSAMARNKLGAHLAVEEGRVDDAVRMFRDFMKHVETWTDATVDPSTGIAHSREMSLGFNAKRIGNIYRDAGRADEADKAYAEARAYFNQAMTDVEEDSKEAAYINEQMAELPKVEPTPSK